MRPSTRSSLPPRPALRNAAFGLACGAASGAVEVALRASPQQGLRPGEVLAWLAISMALAMGLGLFLALFAGWIAPHLPRFGAADDRGRGLVLAGFLGLHAAINYRFEVVLNAFVRDPRVWGAMGGLLLAALGVGLLADPWLRRVERPIQRGLWGAALLSAVAAFPRASAPTGAPGSHPSIVVISLDTTRPDHLSPYGHAIDTPSLARLASEGATFEQAIAAAPITEPSHLAMFTGHPPLATGVLSNGTNLGDRPDLVWRTLQENGYLTAGFVAGFPLHGKYGWGQGMDVYDDDFGAIAGVQALSLVKAYNQVAIKEHALRERPAAQVLARAVPWIAAHRDEQMFAFVHLYDAHGPYDQPSNASLGPAPTAGSLLTLPAYWPAKDRAITSAEWLTRAYDQEIVAVDTAVGRVLAALGPALDRTIVMVTADHGESLTEHGYAFDHGDNLYDPSLRVPWIVRYPPMVTGGKRIGCQVGGVDLAPTVLALAGVDSPVVREGISRAPELTGGECRERPVFASTVAGRGEDPPIDHALRGQGRKLIRHLDGREELFDLTADPGEAVNLAPGGVSEGERALLLGRSSGARSARPELDPETAAMLRALGYTE